MTTFLDLLRASGMTDAEWQRVVALLDDEATTHTPYTPFAPDLQYLLWLTREEFQFAYCLSLALEMEGLLSADLAGTWEEIWATLFKVSYDTGHEWEAVEFDADTALVPKTARAIEPRNLAWVVMLARGQCPDLLVHFPHAVAYAEGNLNLARYVTMLEETHSQIKRDYDKILKVPPTPEEIETMTKFREAAIRRQVVN